MLNMNRALSPGLETVFGPIRGALLHLLDARAPNRRIRRRYQPIVPPAVAAAIKAGEVGNAGTACKRPLLYC